MPRLPTRAVEWAVRLLHGVLADDCDCVRAAACMPDADMNSVVKLKDLFGGASLMSSTVRTQCYLKGEEPANGDTILHIAARLGHYSRAEASSVQTGAELPMYDLLLELGVDPATQNCNGQIAAALVEQVSGRFLPKGAPISKHPRDSLTALFRGAPLVVCCLVLAALLSLIWRL